MGVLLTSSAGLRAPGDLGDVACPLPVGKFISRLRGGVIVVNALLVGTARVLAHVHSPLDIIAGFVFAVVAALLAHWAAPWMMRRLPLAPPPEHPAGNACSGELTRPQLAGPGPPAPIVLPGCASALFAAITRRVPGSPELVRSLVRGGARRGHLH